MLWEVIMKSSVLSVSACRHCRYYEPEGRRGGQCKILGGLVQSSWKSCNLAIPAFAPSWENLEDIMLWQKESLRQETMSFSVDCAIASVDVTELALSERVSVMA